jgi:hypothetical protein
LVQVFDASSKFPSGILFGSTYDFGNFDECMSVSVPLDGDPVTGRYCMAKFHIAPPEFGDGDWRYYRFPSDKNYANVSTWEKIVVSTGVLAHTIRHHFPLASGIFQGSESQHQERLPLLVLHPILLHLRRLAVLFAASHRKIQRSQRLPALR